MSSIDGRILHYALKVTDRKASAHFHKEILGMKVLRHEELGEDGPYVNRRSRTMFGYGPEDSHFIVELAFNYGIKSYEKRNDFISITIRGREILERAKKHNWPILNGNVLEAPGGYQFFIIDEPQPINKDPIEKFTLASSDLAKSIQYWNRILGLTIFAQSDKNVALAFKEAETKLELQYIRDSVKRTDGCGRIAFACPFNQQPQIDAKIKEHNQTIHTPLISVETPGKATARIIIIADPDGHESVFVDEEGFTQLSQVDPEADTLLNKYIENNNYL